MEEELSIMPTTFAVADHLDNREPVVRSTYEALLKAVKKLGPMKEEPKKTSIHFVRSTAFAGIAKESQESSGHKA